MDQIPVQVFIPQPSRDLRDDDQFGAMPELKALVIVHIATL
jgi:hypothetical protein